MKNALTVDVEDWYQTNDFNFPISSWNKFDDRVVENTRILLELFSYYKAKGTFFILGCVAKQHPSLVEEIVKEGHEIASHGGWHRLLNEMTLEEIKEDLLDTKKTLEEISGRRIQMFRAPSWSISPYTYKVLEILQDTGYVYDSSMQPFRTPLSGIRGIPTYPFQPIVDGKELNIFEIPPTVLKILGMNIPFSGGFYLRVMPIQYIKWALKYINRKNPGMIYVHPWEIDVDQPRISAAPLIKLVHYYNIKSTYIKIEKLLKTFSFVPLGEIINLYSFPTVHLYSKQYH